MILNQIWKRYFFFELVKVFSLFLFLFFLFYALLDYSVHMQDFVKDKNLNIIDLLTYFSYQFIKRAALLIPLGLLVATIKTLCNANFHGELVALQAAGVSSKTILGPFFLLATICLLFAGFNTEVLLPRALNYLDNFQTTHFKHDGGKKKNRIHVIYLKDNSKLIYQTYDKQKELLKDVIWILSTDELWRMKALEADPKNPFGYYIDHIERSANGILEKTTSYEKHLFSNLKWEKSMTDKGFIPIENKSVSNLFKLFQELRPAYEKSEILTQLLHKCTIPFLSFLVVFGAAPYCIRYSRNLPTFYIYAVALFAFLSLFALLNAAVILGENNAVSPYVATLVPFGLICLLCTWKFIHTLRR